MRPLLLLLTAALVVATAAAAEAPTAAAAPAAAAAAAGTDGWDARLRATWRLLAVGGSRKETLAVARSERNSSAADTWLWPQCAPRPFAPGGGTSTLDDDGNQAGQLIKFGETVSLNFESEGFLDSLLLSQPLELLSFSVFVSVFGFLLSLHAGAMPVGCWACRISPVATERRDALAQMLHMQCRADLKRALSLPAAPIESHSSAVCGMQAFRSPLLHCSAAAAQGLPSSGRPERHSRCSRCSGHSASCGPPSRRRSERPWPQAHPTRSRPRPVAAGGSRSCSHSSRSVGARWACRQLTSKPHNHPHQTSSSAQRLAAHRLLRLLHRCPGRAHQQQARQENQQRSRPLLLARRPRLCRLQPPSGRPQPLTRSSRALHQRRLPLPSAHRWPQLQLARPPLWMLLCHQRSWECHCRTRELGAGAHPGRPRHQCLSSPEPALARPTRAPRLRRRQRHRRHSLHPSRRPCQCRQACSACRRLSPPPRGLQLSQPQPARPQHPAVVAALTSAMTAAKQAQQAQQA